MAIGARGRSVIGIAAGVAVLGVAALLLWWRLPRWAPRWCAQHAPIADMALRGLAEVSRPAGGGAPGVASIADERLHWIFARTLAGGSRTTRSLSLRLLMEDYAELRLAAAGPATAPHGLASMTRDDGIAARILRAQLPLEEDRDFLVAELALLSLLRSSGDASACAGWLDHADPQVRAAAIDALGFIHRPIWLGPVDSWNDVLALRGPDGEPIRITHWWRALQVQHRISTQRAGDDARPLAEVVLPDDLRARIARMLADDADAGVRAAAARALVGWPAVGQRLRIAEWGVWIQDGGGVAAPTPEQMPAFVDRCWGPIADLADRFSRRPIFVTKPVLHLSSDRLMAVDIEVNIRDGVPWFAAPRPDDYSVLIESEDPLSAAARSSLPKTGGPAAARDASIPDAREGYPWMLRPHLPRGDLIAGLGVPTRMSGVGLRWQSLVVSPEPLPWMRAIPVGGDPRHAWWQRLREAPCAWVANRGTTERFVFYDGPTSAPSPLVLEQRDGVVHALATAATHAAEARGAAHEPPAGASSTWPAILIDVADGRVRGAAADLHPGLALPLATLRWRDGADAALDLLRAELRRAGLDAPEAEALIACWPEFTGVAGVRCLTVLPRAVYDRRLPIRIDPVPTELVRVGLLLSELGPMPSAADER